MANHGAGPMSRIESGPAATGQQRLNPRMACQFGRRSAYSPARVRGEIAGNIARRNSGQAKQTDAEVREILTYSAARSEDIVNGGVYVGGVAVIGKLTAHVKDRALRVRRDVFG